MAERRPRRAGHRPSGPAGSAPAGGAALLALLLAACGAAGSSGDEAVTSTAATAGPSVVALPSDPSPVPTPTAAPSAAPSSAPAPAPSASVPDADPSGAPAPAPSASAAVPASPPATLAPTTPWTAGPGEVQPQVKTTATRFVELAGTWQDGAGDTAALGARLAAAGLDPALAAQTTKLLDGEAVAASVTVEHPQWGGLTDTAASVMTLLRQHLLLPDGTQVSRQVVVDVRLAPTAPDGPWVVTAVSPDPEVPAAGVVTPLAQRVLDEADLGLPAPARRDIAQGRLDERLLGLLEGLAADHVVDVQVLYSGHPTNVFATDRASNHSVGRAVDIWRVDGELVVDPATPRALLQEVMVRAAALGATEVGGPFDVNGDGPGFFTNPSHSDHIHAGISEGRPPVPLP